MTTRIAPRVLSSLLLAGLLAACGPIGGASPSTTPGPEPSTVMSAAALRISLIDQLGPLWYCDPDSYPIPRGDEQDRAIERFPEIRADSEMFDALTAHLGIKPGADPTDAEKLELYQLWKVASAITLESIGGGRYRFDYLAQPAGGASEGTRTAGIIDDHGAITVEQQAPAPEPMCPICLARGTPIEGPDGPMPVDRLRLGDTIWTLNRAGRRVAGTVIALGSTAAPRDHNVIEVTLADGRRVTASPGHPLADGRSIGELRIGDSLDGSTITGVRRLAYQGGLTFDLVVSGETGIYLAGGIPLRSTLEAGSRR
ncbi:MAG TPA: Hint domain-containing protein [Candidatus Limnocylindria bacterium]|nr:Hint domain-containing protein [Candidatus Limnocylindria bacterium]